LIADPEDSDWFDYALRLAHLQDSLFGLPFSGDALVLVYRNEIISQPPATMAQVLQSSGALAFPAADPQALFTLALYQAEGGEVLDGEGRPILQEQPLTRVLTALLEGAQSERLPFWLTQFQSDDQAWEAFQRGQADMVITWSSRFLHTRPEGASMALLPTLDGAAFTLATGWMWALAGPSPESQEAAAQLAEFLSESDFLGEWTETTGYLPPHPRALSDWQDSQLRTFIRQVSLSAHLVPSADVLPGLAAPLVEATAEMLKLENDPATAAREAVESLQAP
jgi:ABC-type glycerol-3-phosphate transport system substrate-binding protein